MLINIKLNMYGNILSVTTKIKEIKYMTSKPVEEVKWDKKKIQLKKRKNNN